VRRGVRRKERRQDAGSDDEPSSFFRRTRKASVPAAWVRGPPDRSYSARYSANTARSFSRAFAWQRETCICETLRRLAISVCETDS